MTGPAASLLGTYSAGDTWLHRLPAGAKLGGLFVAGLLVALWHGYAGALLLLAAALMILASGRVRWRPLLRGLRGILVVAVLLGGWHVWHNGWGRAAEVVADLLSLAPLATAITATTPLDAMLDTLTRLLGPLRRVGVDPEQVALAFSLTLRAIPSTIALAEETRDAARARGLERDPRARLVPLVLRTVANARSTGEALHSRGIAD